MPKLNMTPYQRHVAKWGKCKQCDLCHHRKHVVLLRGTVPAPILFVGEAPGESEDVRGIPFDGPAGQLLDHIIEQAGIPEKKCAWTNLIACIPRDETQTKLAVPPKFAIDACTDRLRECVSLVKPKLLVWVGKEAAKHAPKIAAQAIYCKDWGPWTVEIMHPAYILRAHIAQQSLMIQRCVVALADAAEEAL